MIFGNVSKIINLKSEEPLGLRKSRLWMKTNRSRN